MWDFSKQSLLVHLNVDSESQSKDEKVIQCPHPICPLTSSESLPNKVPISVICDVLHCPLETGERPETPVKKSLEAHQSVMTFHH